MVIRGTIHVKTIEHIREEAKMVWTRIPDNSAGRLPYDARVDPW